MHTSGRPRLIVAYQLLAEATRVSDSSCPPRPATAILSLSLQHHVTFQSKVHACETRPLLSLQAPSDHERHKLLAALPVVSTSALGCPVSLTKPLFSLHQVLWDGSKAGVDSQMLRWSKIEMSLTDQFCTESLWVLPCVLAYQNVSTCWDICEK